MRRRVAEYDWNRIGWIAAAEVGGLAIIASFFLDGGQDLYLYYLPFAGGCLECGFVPYFAQWFLWPLTLVPAALAWPLWMGTTVAGLLLLCRHTGINPGIFMLSFPVLGQLWLGQIDVLVAVGLALALLGRNPTVRGIGIVLALVKPQLAGLAILVLLLHVPRRDLGRLLLAPVLALVASVVVYGPGWPLAWLFNAADNLPIHSWRLAAMDLWPYGLLFIPLLIGFPTVHPCFRASLIIWALATPFFGVYSYLIFLLFRAPWWSLPLSYAWLLLYPFLGNDAMRLAWILPVALLGDVLVRESVWEERLANVFKRA